MESRTDCIRKKEIRWVCEEDEGEGDRVGDEGKEIRDMRGWVCESRG